MKQLFTAFLILHVIGGTLGLLAGSYVMIAKKGDKTHKLIGKIFAYSMLASGLCSFVLSILHDNMFLFSVGVFTIFMASTGWRYLYLKNVANGQKPLIIDWILMVFMFVFSLMFIYIGILGLIDGNLFSIVSILFSWRGVVMVKRDFIIYRGTITVKNYWLTKHLQRMSGAYIASLTAFIVVNVRLDKLNEQTWTNYAWPLLWLLPAACIVPIIIKWTRKYQVKMRKEEV